MWNLNDAFMSGVGSWHVHDNTGQLPPGQWHRCFEKKLGATLGDAKVTGPPGCNASWLDPDAPWAVRSVRGCQFERKFASGTVVRFDGVGNTGSIEWSSDPAEVDPAHSCDTA